MKLPIFAGLALLGAAMATAAHAQLVHISATGYIRAAQFVGYAQALRPAAGTAKFDLYYDASVVGTDGIFTINDPTKNYWTVSATLNPDSTDPNATLYKLRKISSPLETMSLAPATEEPLPGNFALSGWTSNAHFDFGLFPSGPPNALPVPPFTFGRNFNDFYVEFPNHPDRPSDDGTDWGSIYGAGLHNFSAEIISPVPEPSIYGLGGGIAALCCIVYNWRRRAP